MATEPDLRPPPFGDSEPDWDNLDASYEAPGARDVVPEMPPIPDVTTLDPPTDNWAWAPYDDHYHEPRKAFPAPNRKIVGKGNPLEVDVFYSMRSPYSYLALSRLAYLHSNFHVNVNVGVIFPIAARTAKPGQASALGGRWYFWGYSVGIDMARTGRYEGIPWRFASSLLARSGGPSAPEASKHEHRDDLRRRFDEPLRCRDRALRQRHVRLGRQHCSAPHSHCEYQQAGRWKTFD